MERSQRADPTGKLSNAWHKAEILLRDVSVEAGCMLAPSPGIHFLSRYFIPRRVHTDILRGPSGPINSNLFAFRRFATGVMSLTVLHFSISPELTRSEAAAISPAARLLSTAHTAVPGTAAPVPASPYGRWAIAQRFARRRVGAEAAGAGRRRTAGALAGRTNRRRTAAPRTAITPAPDVTFQSHRRPERTKRRGIADRRTRTHQLAEREIGRDLAPQILPPRRAAAA